MINLLGIYPADAIVNGFFYWQEDSWYLVVLGNQLARITRKSLK